MQPIAPDDVVRQAVIAAGVADEATLAAIRTANPDRPLAEAVVEAGLIGATSLEALIAGSPTQLAMAQTMVAGGPPPPPPPASGSMIGRVLGGKYRITEQIGRGGMGTVYRAEQVDLDRPCAVKILPREMAASAELVTRFAREAKATAQLDHENVVKIFDIDRDGDDQFIAMELIAGQSLGARLTRGPLDWREAFEIGTQIAAALEAAHAAGIVHRDIKPDNVMQTPSGRVKVMDFGLARLATEASKLSRTGQVIGTPHYMAPEQAAGERVDARADVYALGATLFALVTGRPPFLGDVPLAVMLRVRDDQAPRADEVAPDVPRAAADVIHALTLHGADRRLSTAAEAGAVLRAALAGRRPELPPLTEPRAGRRLLAVVVVVLAVAALAALRHQLKRLEVSAGSTPPERTGAGSGSGPAAGSSDDELVAAWKDLAADSEAAFDRRAAALSKRTLSEASRWALTVLRLRRAGALEACEQLLRTPASEARLAALPEALRTGLEETREALGLSATAYRLDGPLSKGPGDVLTRKAPGLGRWEKDLDLTRTLAHMARVDGPPFAYADGAWRGQGVHALRYEAWDLAELHVELTVQPRAVPRVVGWLLRPVTPGRTAGRPPLFLALRLAADGGADVRAEIRDGLDLGHVIRPAFAPRIVRVDRAQRIALQAVQAPGSVAVVVNAHRHVLPREFATAYGGPVRALLVVSGPGVEIRRIRIARR